MGNSTEKKMTEFMQPLFGDMARKTLERQKEKLRLNKGELTKEQYAQIVEAISDLCLKMAGAAISEKVRKGLMEIVRAES
jgi:hypothetical protein